MDKALSFFGLGAGEKAVEGTFDCLKNWISGRNAAELEREKTKQYAIKGGVALGVTALTYLFASQYDKVDAGVDRNGAHLHAEK